MGIYYQHILTLLNDGSTKTLDKAPIGWDTFERSYERSPTYHGILRSEGGDLRFVNVGGRIFDKGGYFFIKDAMDTYGIKAQIKYEKKRRNNFTWGFDDDYVGLMDLTTDGEPVEFPHENYIEIRCIESGKLQSFVANSEKNYSLDSLTATNGNTITAFTNHPRAINFTAIDVYLMVEQVGVFSKLLTGFASTDPPDTFLSCDYFAGEDSNIDTEVSTNEISERLQTEVGDVTFQSIGTPPLVLDSGYFPENTTSEIYENDTSSDVSLEFRDVSTSEHNSKIQVITGSANIVIVAYVTYKVYDSDDVEIESTYVFEQSFSAPFDDPEYVTFNLDYLLTNPISVPAGGKVTLTSSLVPLYTGSAGGFYKVSYKANLDFVERSISVGDTEVDTYLTYEIMTRLLQLSTGETDTSKLLESNIFGRTDSEFQTYASDGDLSKIATTSGKLLRQFPEGKVKVNIKDWFRSVSRMKTIALWHERDNDRFKVEEIEQAYKDQQILDLGVVSNLRIKPYKGGYWSQLLTGSKEKGDYEQSQGITEYNIQSEHETDMPIVNKLDLRVIYNTDSLGMEYARRKPYSEFASEDTKQDDKNYLVETDGTNTVTFDDITSSVSGFEGIGERYNGNYTPRRCILNNGNWIAGMFWKDSGNNINFVNNSKDINITYDGVNEQDPIPQADLGTPLFYPVVYEFDFESNYEMIEQLESDPHGYIKFTNSDGDDLYGYIDSIKIEDYKKKGSAVLIQANINR